MGGVGGPAGDDGVGEPVVARDVEEFRGAPLRWHLADGERAGHQAVEGQQVGGVAGAGDDVPPEHDGGLAHPGQVRCQARVLLDGPQDRGPDRRVAALGAEPGRVDADAGPHLQHVADQGVHREGVVEPGEGEGEVEPGVHPPVQHPGGAALADPHQAELLQPA